MFGAPSSLRTVFIGCVDSRCAESHNRRIGICHEVSNIFPSANQRPFMFTQAGGALCVLGPSVADELKIPLSTERLQRLDVLRRNYELHTEVFRGAGVKRVVLSTHRGGCRGLQWFLGEIHPDEEDERAYRVVRAAARSLQREGGFLEVEACIVCIAPGGSGFSRVERIDF